MPSQKLLRDAIEKNDLMIDSIEPFYISSQLSDFFLYSGKQRPNMYLSPSIRAGISLIQEFSTEQELENGLELLNEDIESGAINEVMEKYENEIGDYIFIVTSKADCLDKLI